MKVVAIILARAGSKGIPRKNIIDFCGKPLLAWTIEQCLAGGVDLVYTSSDADEILAIGEKYGARSIKRPIELSGDEATSESGLLHALDIIEADIDKLDWIIAPQVTSPIRSSGDIISAIELANLDKFDSILSVVKVEDFFIWGKDKEDNINSLNYNYKNRKRRQDIDIKYLENGSFYLFKPEILRTFNNRLGGKISIFEMDKHKMFQIDNKEDLKLCEAVMKGYGYY